MGVQPFLPTPFHSILKVFKSQDPVVLVRARVAEVTLAIIRIALTHTSRKKHLYTFYTLHSYCTRNNR